MIRSMAELRRKHASTPNEIVPHETISLKDHARAPESRPPESRRGMGVDWTEPEIEVLRRKDISPEEMQPLLPGRTDRAIRLKRHRLGLCRRYQKTVAA